MMRKICSFLIVLILGADLSASPNPKIIDAKLDITDLENHVLNLEGELYFFRNKFCDPLLLLKQSFPTQPSLTGDEANPGGDCKPEEAKIKTMGKPWNQHPKLGVRRPDHGFGSYHFQIITNPKKKYSLYVPIIATSHKLYINGELVGEVGELGKNEEESKGYFTNYVVNLPKSEKIDVVVHVSNFDHVSSGLWRKFKIGESQIIEKQYFLSYSVDLFIFGAFFVMAFYHLILFLLRKKDRSNLYFGMFLVLLAFRSIVTGESLLYKYLGMEYFSLDWGLRIEFSAFYFGIPFSLLYLQSIYPKQILRLVSISLIVIFGSVGLSTFFLPAKIFTFFTAFIEYLILITGIYIIYVVIRAIQDKEEDSKLFLSGFIVFFLFVINDLMFTRYLFGRGNYSHVSFFLFVMFQSFFISRRFSKAFNNVEMLSENLEKLVEVRTEQYKSEKEKAELASEWKNKLISLVAHDLRSPLATYYSTLELLETDNELSEEERIEFIQAAKKRVQHTLFSISHILNLDRFQSGGFTPQFKIVYLEDVLKDLLPSLTEELESKHQKITKNISQNDQVYIDITLFKEILRNIILNASKFSPPYSEIIIEDSGDPNYIVISIIDHGIGMSQDVIDNILQGNKQESGRGTSGEIGFGIGMTICIELIKAHAGKLKIESNIGIGSKFSIYLPKIEIGNNKS